uniref:Gsp-co-occurring protein 14 n=1 Tax=Malawimonas jakobiformis TaxID=136089 RepID=A0A895KR75_MALJA|nr:Gsp-co-occurring protein 14 [Malawimonas jakobiformis]
MSSRALIQPGSSWDIPKTLLKAGLWAWFLFRVGESLMYTLLARFNIVHTPRWRYDMNKKYSENIETFRRWKRSRLFDAPPSAVPAGSGTAIARPDRSRLA